MAEAPTSPATFALPPADGRRLQLHSIRSVTTDLVGQYKSAFRGSGLVFSDLREYQPGDDVKHIHWRATARSGTVYVKSYEQDRQLSVLLAVDISSSVLRGMGGSTLRRELEFLALVSNLTLRGNDLLGVLTFTDSVQSYLPPRSGRTHYRRAIGSLVKTALAGGHTEVSVALNHVAYTLRRPSVVFVLSDFFCGPFDLALRKAAERHDVVLVVVDVPNISSLPNVGLVELTDSESGDEVLFDTASRRGKAGLADYMRTRRDRILEVARSTGVDCIELKESAFEPLARLMQERSLKYR